MPLQPKRPLNKAERMNIEVTTLPSTDSGESYLIKLDGMVTVSYTHLTLPTNREV